MNLPASKISLSLVAASLATGFVGLQASPALASFESPVTFTFEAEVFSSNGSFDGDVGYGSFTIDFDNVDFIDGVGFASPNNGALVEFLVTINDENLSPSNDIDFDSFPRVDLDENHNPISLDFVAERFDDVNPTNFNDPRILSIFLADELIPAGFDPFSASLSSASATAPVDFVTTAFIQEVPTPALLPGLIGMGIASLRRKQKQAVEATALVS